MKDFHRAAIAFVSFGVLSRKYYRTDHNARVTLVHKQSEIKDVFQVTGQLDSKGLNLEMRHRSKSDELCVVKNFYGNNWLSVSNSRYELSFDTWSDYTDSVSKEIKMEGYKISTGFLQFNGSFDHKFEFNVRSESLEKAAAVEIEYDQQIWQARVSLSYF